MSETHVTELVERPLVASRARVASASATAILASLALAKLLIQFAGIRHYGFFRDELYYMACGEHLAWGYVDQPPLIALIAWFSRHAFGNSLFSMRLLPALTGAAVVLMTGLFARELGGRRFAQFLASTAMLFAPAYLAFDSFLSMNAFEPLFWLLCAWSVVRIVKGATLRWWLVFGAVSGIALENKHSMLVFGFAVVAGLLLSREHRLLNTKWLWLGGLVALALFAPNLIWEARHGWPQVEVVRNAQTYKNLAITPWEFIGDQIAFLGPLSLPVWTGGLIWVFYARKGKPFRFLGCAYLLVIAIFIFMHGKSYYPLPVYPMLIAAGGVAIEQCTVSGATRRLRTALVILIVAGGLFAVPFGVPVLPIDTFLRYSRALPFSSLAKTERDAVSVELPQLYADMFGWDNTTATVAGVYRSIPTAERADCAILGGNYGEAGAIDYYGPAYGLPKAISGHNSYFYWGPRNYSGRCMIVFGERSNEFVTFFGDVHQAATIISPHAMANEQSVPVYICRKPVAPLSALWPRFKMII